MPKKSVFYEIVLAATEKRLMETLMELGYKLVEADEIAYSIAPAVVRMQLEAERVGENFATTVILEKVAAMGPGLNYLSIYPSARAMNN